MTHALCKSHSTMKLPFWNLIGLPHSPPLMCHSLRATRISVTSRIPNAPASLEFGAQTLQIPTNTLHWMRSSMSRPLSAARRLTCSVAFTSTTTRPTITTASPTMTLVTLEPTRTWVLPTQIAKQTRTSTRPRTTSNTPMTHAPPCGPAIYRIATRNCAIPSPACWKLSQKLSIASATK